MAYVNLIFQAESRKVTHFCMHVMVDGWHTENGTPWTWKQAAQWFEILIALQFLIGIITLW